MHYGARAFSRNGQPTILPVDTSFPLNRIGQRNGLSASDIQHVRTLYCSGKLSLYCLILSYFHLPTILIISWFLCLSVFSWLAIIWLLVVFTYSFVYQFVYLLFIYRPTPLTPPHTHMYPSMWCPYVYVYIIP